MVKLSNKEALIVGMLAGAGIMYIVMSNKISLYNIRLPRGAIAMAVTPKIPSGGGTTKFVDVNITVKITGGTTPINLTGKCKVHDNVFNSDIIVKNFSTNIYKTPYTYTYKFTFNGIAGHTYDITSSVVLSNNAGSKTLSARKTVSLPKPKVPPSGYMTISVTYH